MPLRSSKERQHSREQESADHQNRNTNSGCMPVKLAVFILDKAVKQVDWDDEKCSDHDGDERAC